MSESLPPILRAGDSNQPLDLYDGQPITVHDKELNELYRGQVCLPQNEDATVNRLPDPLEIRPRKDMHGKPMGKGKIRTIPLARLLGDNPTVIIF